MLTQNENFWNTPEKLDDEQRAWPFTGPSAWWEGGAAGVEPEPDTAPHVAARTSRPHTLPLCFYCKHRPGRRCTASGLAGTSRAVQEFTGQQLPKPSVTGGRVRTACSPCGVGTECVAGDRLRLKPPAGKSGTQRCWSVYIC